MGAERPVAFVTAPMRGPGLEVLRGVCDVVIDPWIDHMPLRLLDGKGLAAKVRETGATVLIVESDFVMGDEIMDSGLILIGSCRGDPNNVDLAAATARGIPVIHAPGRNADGVAEIAVGLLFAVSRHLVAADADVRAGRVFAGGSIPYQRFRAWQLAGRTIGIVGLGAVGRAAAWRFRGLGMEVISYDPFNPEATHDSLDALLADSDVISMHAAPTPGTIGMIGEAQFAAMRPGAIYINSARGGLHDLDALVAALESGHLAGAGLDHVDGEVLPDGHPLLSRSDVVITPHIGGATYDTEANHSTMIAEDVATVLAGGRPARCANPEVYDVEGSR